MIKRIVTVVLILVFLLAVFGSGVVLARATVPWTVPVVELQPRDAVMVRCVGDLDELVATYYGDREVVIDCRLYEE